MDQLPIFDESTLAPGYAEAKKLSNAGKFPIAADRFRSLASDSNDPLEKANYLIEEAECHRQVREFEKAAQCVTEAQGLADSDVIASLQIRYFGATLLISQDRREEGLDVLSVILKDNWSDLQQGEGRELYEEIQIQRSFTLMFLERYVDARPLLEQVATFALPANRRSGVHCHLGRCYVELGLYEEARSQFKQAEVIGVSDQWGPTFHYHWGYALYKQGEFAAARRELFLCLQSGTDGYPRSSAYKLLAAVCRKLGDRGQARIYEKSAKSG